MPLRRIRKTTLHIWRWAISTLPSGTSAPPKPSTKALISACQAILLIVAGGANAALESHNMDLAQRWLERANEKMSANVQVQRERERYLTFRGQYAESAQLGQSVIAKLPNDREGVDYLAYDLYYLGRYDEALALAKKYEPILPNDKDLPLIAGNVYVHNGDLQAALENFTRALELDPKMATGYVNRGFVWNDLKQAAKASKDFQTALKLQPDYGEAHLGLAYADLQLHRPKPALKQLEAAQKSLGKSRPWHLARAEAFRQEVDYPHAAAEYRTALAEDPKDITTQLAYADVLYRMRQYGEAIAALNDALKLAPSEPAIYALMAQLHAKQGERDQTLRDIQEADRLGGNRLEILTATGDALLTLGDRDAAMQRFSRALEVPGGNRIGIRLALAQIFLRQGHADEARRQIALGFAEARMIPDSPVNGQDFADAGNLFLAMHDFDLAEQYFSRAQMAGANNRAVAIGLTNTYLAEGNTQKAGSTLASLGPAKRLPRRLRLHDGVGESLPPASRPAPFARIVRAGQHHRGTGRSRSGGNLSIHRSRAGRSPDQRQHQFRSGGSVRSCF